MHRDDCSWHYEAPCDCGADTESLVVLRGRVAELERRPTVEAYDAACKALWHWRKEAKRLAKLAGVEPRQMVE